MPESGGQGCDTGYLLPLWCRIAGISGCSKQSDLFIHIGQVERGEIAVMDTVNAQIAVSERRRSQAHHTAIPFKAVSRASRKLLILIFLKQVH
jgi:alanyl-tRNA synthetase